MDAAGPPLAGASSFDAQYPPPLTPAQRLIERYERFNTPPPHTPPSHSILSPEKSTFKRQYVYDYRDDPSRRAAESLATPDSVRDRGLKDGRIHGFGAKKDKSPIRQSLRNLFSVIRKGAGGLAKRRSEDRLGSATWAPPTGVTVAKKLSPSPSSVVVDEGKTFEPMKANPVATSARPQKKRITGPLFYLTREEPTLISAPCQLVWVSCSVTIDVDAHKLLVTSFTGPGTDIELCIHEILLSQCTDIRSLGVTQLGNEEKKALDEAVGPEKETLRVFEVLFEGREREKFAATSVKERAGWISAMWDAILPEQQSGYCNHASRIAQPMVDHPHKILKVESPRPTPLPHLSPLLMHKPSLSDRSLPPIPPKSPLPPVEPLSIPAKNKPNLYLDLSEFDGPISPSIYPPTSMAGSLAGTEVPIDMDGIVKTDSERPKHLRLDMTSTSEDGDRVISPSVYVGTSTYSSRPTSLFVSSPISPGSATSYSSPFTSRANSPSISNLSQLSVVRQRLAQIERNHSQLSAQSIRTETPPTRSAASSPVNRGGSSNGWERREAAFHNNSSAKRAKSVVSTAAGSIRSKDEVERGAVPPMMKRPSPQREEERRAAAAAARTQRHISSNDRRTNHRRINDADRHIPVPPSPSAATPKARAGVSKEADTWKHFSRELVDIKAALGGESGDATIHQMVSGLEDRMRSEHKVLRSIQGGLHDLKERVAEAVASASAPASSTAAVINAHGGAKMEALVLESNKEMMQVLDEVKVRLSTELPTLLTKVEELRKIQENEILQREKETEQPIDILRNVAKSSSSGGGDEPKAVDLKPVLDKLEEIRTLCDVPPKQEEEKEVDRAKEEDSQLTLEHLQKILNIVQEDGSKQTLLSQQQADSVRYLNELNNWLEAFVNNGTSQIQGISTNVDRLCLELGLSEDSSPNAPPGQHLQKGAAPSRPNLIKDIHQLMQGIQARDQNFVALQGAVHALLEVLTVSQTQQGAESQAIAGLIDRQRHEQEALFRAFTNEISGEIKGERLRFVEAMKEATAINIQMHVEQFKQELGREVMAMTEEVGRLHREKQQVENQISDLFSFYSKHKQAEMPLQTNVDMPPPKQAHPQERERARANIPRSQHRLLPYPRHS
ncbi:hypothetical protein M413DRAFT_24527 [Hebeloma cylindrosporum]|uniref:PH domain-containing protein n=1 Tax=Hebeloma cylindrosporum TaxID=76867 RepID=A0A0C2Y617_HEBCY|nr:hypothetical protein M413DRAFT_24527 [Hebeloma cylindrosporum h7]